MAQQQDEEDLVDYHKRFMSMNEMVERAYGAVAPLAVAKKNTTAYGKDPDGTLLAEKNRMLAYLFMDGADKKIFSYLLKNMSNDHALGTKKYPEDVETALQIMMLFQEGAQKKMDAEKRRKQAEDESPGLSFAQMTKAQMMKNGLCFKCGKKGHCANECKKPTEADKSVNGIGAAQRTQDEDVTSWMD